MTQWIVTLCEQDAIVKLKEAGADELLVSVPFFSLRAARVFSCDQLAELSAKIHDAGMRIAVNCTRFFMEDELEQLRSFLRLLKEIDADTVYFADEGVLYEAHSAGDAGSSRLSAGHADHQQRRRGVLPRAGVSGRFAGQGDHAGGDLCDRFPLQRRGNARAWALLDHAPADGSCCTVILRF